MVPSVDKQSNTQITAIQSARPTPGAKILTTRSGTSRYGILSRAPSVGSYIIVNPGLFPTGIAGSSIEQIIEPLQCVIDLNRFVLVMGDETIYPRLSFCDPASYVYYPAITASPDPGPAGLGMDSRYFAVASTDSQLNGDIWGDFYIEYNHAFIEHKHYITAYGYCDNLEYVPGTPNAAVPDIKPYLEFVPNEKSEITVASEVVEQTYKIVGTRAYYGGEEIIRQCGHAYSGSLSILFDTGFQSPTAVAIVEIGLCSTTPNRLIIETYGERSVKDELTLWFNKGTEASPDWVILNTIAKSISNHTLPYKREIFTFKEDKRDGVTTIDCCNTCFPCACKPCDITNTFYVIKQGTSTKLYGTRFTFGWYDFGKYTIVWNIDVNDTYNLYYLDASNVQHLLGTYSINPYDSDNYEIAVEYDLQCQSIKTWAYSPISVASPDIPTPDEAEFTFPYLRTCNPTFYAVASEDVITYTTNSRVPVIIPKAVQNCLVDPDTMLYMPFCYYNGVMMYYTANVDSIIDNYRVKLKNITKYFSPSYTINSGYRESYLTFTSELTYPYAASVDVALNGNLYIRCAAIGHPNLCHLASATLNFEVWAYRPNGSLVKAAGYVRFGISVSARRVSTGWSYGGDVITKQEFTISSGNPGSITITERGIPGFISGNEAWNNVYGTEYAAFYIEPFVGQWDRTKYRLDYTISNVVYHDSLHNVIASSHTAEMFCSDKVGNQRMLHGYTSGCSYLAP